MSSYDRGVSTVQYQEAKLTGTAWIPGFCKVDETPKGWYIQYIDRDPETIRKQEEQARKKKHELDDEERSAKFIEEQVRRGLDSKETEVSPSSMLARLCLARVRAGIIWNVFNPAGNSGLHRAEA